MPVCHKQTHRVTIRSTNSIQHKFLQFIANTPQGRLTIRTPDFDRLCCLRRQSTASGVLRHHADEVLVALQQRADLEAAGV